MMNRLANDIAIESNEPYAMMSARNRYIRVRGIAERIVVAIALPFLLPLFALIALAIRLDSRGPILFRQVRPGRGESSFVILKFRTMYDRAEVGRVVLTRPGDTRITRAGRLIRRFHLDELPQLWNILRGEMSLVGPRPEPLDATQMFEALLPDYHRRRSVPPGLTGLAQISLGYTDDLDGAVKKLSYDLDYIRNISPLLDLKILARTVVVVVTMRGAR